MNSNNDLLELIYREPDNDEPRLVYADWLLARGDPRGEHIMLQFKRAASGLSMAEDGREKALLHRHGAHWLGSIAEAIDCSTMVFRKGFLAECSARFKSQAHKRQLMRLPEWATIEHLTRCTVGGRTESSFFLSSALSSLRGLGPLSFDDLEELARRIARRPPFHISTVRAVVTTPHWQRAGAEFLNQSFPVLRHLELSHPPSFSLRRGRISGEHHGPQPGGDLDPGAYASFLGHPSLDSLTVRKPVTLSYRALRDLAAAPEQMVPRPDLAAWREALATIKHPPRVALQPSYGWTFTLERNQRGIALTIDWNPRAATGAIEGLQRALSSLPKAPKDPLFHAVLVRVDGYARAHFETRLQAALGHLGPVELMHCYR